MSYYMICPKCGKGTIGRYATDNSLCGECSDNSSTEAVYTESQVKKLTGENKVEKLQEQLNTTKKALTEISKTKDFYRSGRDHWEEFSQDALKAQKALAAIGWGGCPVGAVGKNGLTKEEIEGSGDE